MGLLGSSRIRRKTIRTHAFMRWRNNDELLHGLPQPVMLIKIQQRELVAARFRTCLPSQAENRYMALVLLRRPDRLALPAARPPGELHHLQLVPRRQPGDEFIVARPDIGSTQAPEFVGSGCARDPTEVPRRSHGIPERFHADSTEVRQRWVGDWVGRAQIQLFMRVDQFPLYNPICIEIVGQL